VVPSGPTPGSPSRDPLILVVEDEALIAMDLERTLRLNGHRVLGPAMTVAAALRLLDGEAPDVALLDVNLRGEMVTPVAEALRARGVPFVLASAYEGAQLTAAVLAGAPNVGKPVNVRRLFATLARAVRP
jgi:DNA-binding response OmpR family regulator